jgi:hypothetical protein
MSHNKLPPEQHFKLVYKSKIEMTTEKTYMYDPINVSYGPNPHSMHIQQREEPVVAIKMPQSEYERFINGYRDYLQLIYGMQDPIARDMFEKMMIYIKLKD